MTDPGRSAAPAMDASLHTDVLIVGAGPVGMTLARALAAGPWRVHLLDARAQGAADDPRALALAHGSRQLLERLDAWNGAAATPIRRIHVSQRGGFARTVLAASDYGVPALGYVMRYRDLAGALAARLDAEQILAPARVEQIAAGHDSVIVSAAHGGATTTISARLVVHAEGTPGDDPGIRVHDYHQHAVIAEVEPREVHGGQAWERFTPDGPLALLPLGTGYALVYSAPPARAAELLRLDDAGFLSALRQQFGTRLDFVGCGARSAFPLARRVRTQLCAERQVWIGNAAQTLHPVSGQGFNLGLRDAWELAAALLADSARDPGDADLLAAYARARQLDRRGGAAFTDGIVRLFSNDIAPLRLARGLGLFALDALPPLRHFVAKRMIWGARAWP